NLSGAKISKSAGNMVNLSALTAQGFHPLAYRYLLLGAHYRTPLNFTETALAAAQQTLPHLVSLRLSLGSDTGAVSGAWKAEFEKHVNNDLDTPGALATLWNMTRDSALSDAEKLSTLLDMDRVLGLSLQEPDGQLRTLAGAAVKESDLPEPVRELLRQREI